MYLLSTDNSEQRIDEPPNNPPVICFEQMAIISNAAIIISGAGDCYYDGCGRIQIIFQFAVINIVAMFLLPNVECRSIIQ